MTPETLARHFDLLTDAPSAAKKLRELVLGLAVQGKLVEQDPSDEPASVLLGRIEAKKEQLHRDGQISKLKKLTKIDADEVPYQLPKMWLWVRLGRVVEYNAGSRVDPSEIPDDAWLLDLGDIEKDTSVVLERVPNRERQSKSTKSTFQAGDVLYGKLRPYLNKVVVADAEGYCTTEIVPLRGYLGIYPKFLMYALKRPDFLEYANSKTYGINLPRLSTTDGEKALFPLPPLEEQKRIVAKVDELMGLIDRLEAQQRAKHEARLSFGSAALGSLLGAEDAGTFAGHWRRVRDSFDLLCSTPENVAALRKAVLQLAVQGKLVPQDPDDEPAGVLLERIEAEKQRLVEEAKIRKSKPLPMIKEDEMLFALPKHWEWIRLGQIGDWGAGATPLRSNSDFYGGSILWFKSGELNDGYIFDSEEKITELALQKSSLRISKPGDVLIAMYGATIGKLAILEAEATTNQAVCACTCFAGFYNRFLFLVLNAYKNHFTNQGAGGAQPNISREKIIHTVAPLPPLNEQKRIVAKVDELMGLVDGLEGGLTQARGDAERLLAAVVHRLQAA